MKNVVHEERRTIPEGACPVDLMGELFQTKSEDELLKFTLTFKAFLAMYAFPVKKEVTFFEPLNNEQNVLVKWIPYEDEMSFITCDQCKTFKVSWANTEEIVYESINAFGDEIKHYIIDVE